MKKCPCCGYEPTLTNRQILNRLRKEYGDLPVWEMIHRGWLGEVELTDFAGIQAALMRFFAVKDVKELMNVLNGGRLFEGRVCDTSKGYDGKDKETKTSHCEDSRTA